MGVTAVTHAATLGAMRETLWHHPWAIALLAAAIGFAGELMVYTSEEGAAALYGLAAGLIAYLVVLLRRGRHGHAHPGARRARRADDRRRPPVDLVPPHL